MKKGFTLIELMVALGILAIITVGIYQVMQTGNIVYHRNRGLLEIQQGARLAMDYMVRELRETSDVTSPANGDSSSNITFTTPTAAGVSYTYSNGQITRSFAGNNKVLVNNVSNITFTYNQPVIQIRLTTGKTTLNFPLTYSATATVRLRNE